MKKKLFSTLLMLTIVITLMPMAIMTSYAEEQMLIGSLDDFKNACEENEGIYRLTKDLQLTAEIVFNEDFKLDLNDHVINLNGKGLYVDNSRKFELSDNAATKTTRYYSMDDTGLWTLLADRTAATDGCITVGGVITGGQGHDAEGGGVYIGGFSSFTMNGGNIVGNTSNNGGGVRISSVALFTMNGGNIAGNTAKQYGGGIHSFGTFEMNGGTISGNTSNRGGGVYADKFMMNGGNIVGNISSVASGNYGGGGVYANGDFTMTGGYISANTSSGNGGGVFNEINRTFTMSGGTISDNTAPLGGGVYAGGTFEMNGGNIVDNISSVTSGNYGGGGVYAGDKAKLTMIGGIISGNTAEQYGGGVYVGNGNFIMTGGSIYDNTVRRAGGGVIVYGDNATIGGTAKITGNYLSNGTTADNLYLKKGKTITLNKDEYAPVISGDEKMTVGITMENDTGVFTDGNSADYHELFVPDTGDDYKVINLANDSNKLQLIKKYVVTVDTNIKNGSVTAAVADSKAFDGETIIVTVTPSSGYRLTAGSLKVYKTYDATTTVTVTKQENGTYTFVMPAYAVTITAKFGNNWHSLANAMAGEPQETIPDVFEVSEEDGFRRITLLADITAGEDDNALSVPTGKKIILDLNGHVLDRGFVATDGTPTYTDYGCVIESRGDGFIIKDSNPDVEHKFRKITSGDYAGMWVLDETSGTEIVTGGVITGGTGRKIGVNNFYCGGGVAIINGAATMQAGNIVGNCSNMSGGGVYNSGRFTLGGGNIIGNYSDFAGGGVYVNSSFFTMESGNIINNIARSLGGAVYLHRLSTTVGYMDMIGGVISNNSCTSDPSSSGISVSGYLKLGGTAVIKNNSYNGIIGDVEIFESTVSINSDIPPAEGMCVGLIDHYNRTNNKVINAIAGQEQYFFADDTSKYVAFNNNGTEDNTEDDFLELCNLPESDWGRLALAMAGKAVKTVPNVFTVTDSDDVRTIKLLTDITASEADNALKVNPGKKIILDLNGHTIDRNATEASEEGSVIVVTDNKADLTIKDSSENKTGTITGGWAPKGGGVFVNEGNLTLENGIISGNKATQGGGAVAVLQNSKNDNEEVACFRMTGGEISTNQSDMNGGGVYIEKGTNLLAFIMEGGKITNNTAAQYGGGVYTAKRLEVCNTVVISGNKSNSLGDDDLYLPIKAEQQVPKIVFPEETPLNNDSVIELRTDGEGIISSTAKEECEYEKTIKLHNDEYYIAFKKLNTLQVKLKECKIDDNKYNTLADAVSAAKDNDTIALLAKPIALDEIISIDKTITIDGGEGNKTITAKGEKAFEVKGKLTLKNVTVNTNATGIEVHGDGSELTLDSSATLNAASAYDAYVTKAYGIFASSGAKVTINGKVTNKFSDCAAIECSDTKEDGNITVIVNVGAIIKSQNGLAINLPNVADLTINGGEITGLTGVYIKSGILTIIDGTITATGTKKEYKTETGVCINTGDAVVVDNTGFSEDSPTIRVNNGKFYSKNADPIGSYSTDADEYPAPSHFVKGGFFSAEISDALLYSSEYAVVENTEDSTKEKYPWTIKQKVTSTVTVENDGNGTAKAQVSNVDVTSALEGVTVNLIATPKDGYAFKEWQIARGIEAEDINNNTFTMPANEVKIKAIFERVYRVEVDSDDNGSATAKLNNTSVTEAAAGKNIVFTAVANTDYEFDYWEVIAGDVDIDSTKTNNPITVVMPAKALTLKAHFKETTSPDPGPTPGPHPGPKPVTSYIVKYDLQGHGAAIQDVIARANTMLTAPDDPTADDWTFGGWYKEAGCINAWDFAKDTVKSSMTLYAKWTANKVPILLLKGATSGSKAIKLSWNEIEGATKYYVYGNSCGKTMKLLANTTKNTYKVKAIRGKKLAAHKSYKFYVVAYTADGKLKSKTIHFITGNTKGKYANVKSIKAKYSSLAISVGSAKKLGATYRMYSGKKHIKNVHGNALRYISDCPAVVKVSSSGKILAVAPGTATIYIQDVGGKYCKTVVTVK